MRPGLSATLFICTLAAACGATRVTPEHDSVSARLTEPTITDTTAAERSIKTQQLYVRATVALLLDEGESATELIDQLVQNYPEQPAIYALAAEAREKTGDLASATFFAREAYRSGGANPYYASALAALLRRQGDLAEARRVLEDGVTKHTDHTELRAALAALYADLENPDAAVEQVRILLSSGRDPSRLKRRLLRIAASMTDPPGRIGLLQVLHEADPDDIEVALLYADAVLADGDLDAALAPLDRVLTRFPNHIRARALLERLQTAQPTRAPTHSSIPSTQLSTLQATISEPTSTASDIRLALDLVESDRIEGMDPNAILALRGLGYFRLSAFGRAAALLEPALQQNARDVSLWRAAAISHHRTGRIEAALEICSEGLILFPGDGELTYVSALASLGANDPRSAIELLDEWLSLTGGDPTSDPALRARMTALQALASLDQDPAGRRAVLDSVLAHSPPDPRLLDVAGRFYDRLDARSEKALSYAREAVALTPDDPLLLAQLAGLYRARNQPDAALEWSSKAIETGLADATAYFLQASVLRTLGQDARALNLESEACTRDPEHPLCLPHD